MIEKQKQNKILAWIKWRIARLLDRRKDTCRANLYMWAIGYQTYSETFGVNGNWKSQICKTAYCGKCYITGRLPKP